ncbi:bifunctional glutamate N-acetyltransferase/amino-acid acetyltransferase ArgJ [Methanoculleus thermophilus]|jgi:glutamate N-acetyltransferase/amino-acid N-acetyltransferase|uniref:Glutamate N-acetyltransferase n=1 Tax=Methanoculleus thermophilus TaxID=2200 RepID=A0A1G8ZU93_9EURY|nr:bifunctional glutamate N-acetyltransferase/amino-acid acetyltransferase ArgJ [Methanoculleus thermophilus]NLN09718.1 bifunctional glutamate N-acetyltransferase/amino-acid acetyltransferase ArgJ [Methanoculleus thermophilus]SDK18571.1 glutamate N-acetyltransferase [Methanoculleus thermophilus]HQD27238.1 bifunctional glutamate N-acetyltransferase/amino-acid acetyltransferase ArgJ [Methanoculleus thermophilus]
MKSICAVEGVTAAGIKEGKFGLALIRASGTAAGVFTSNRMRAAPVEVMMERIRRGRLDAVVVNSGCANAYTGERGYRDALEMSAIAADALNLDPASVGVASTGVIGRYLDLDLIRDQCSRVAPLLARSADAEAAAARAIMTTDTFPKHALVETESFTVGGITKGSGMIAPNMGTMLAFIYTDAEVEAPVLQDILRQATRRSFNRVVVDGDTSTNDVALCTATGAAGRVNRDELARAIETVCRDLAVQIARDGEGATKLLTVTVRGAPDEEAAATVARTVVASPLVKTAIYGEDPNWGRVVAAAGRAGVEFDPYAVSLSVGDIPLVRRGEIVADLVAAKAAMRGDTVTFDLDLAAGDGTATAWGCDLTEKYVEINGKYTT